MMQIRILVIYFSFSLSMFWFAEYVCVQNRYRIQNLYLIQAFGVRNTLSIYQIQIIKLAMDVIEIICTSLNKCKLLLILYTCIVLYITPQKCNGQKSFELYFQHIFAVVAVVLFFAPYTNSILACVCFARYHKSIQTVSFYCYGTFVYKRSE